MARNFFSICMLLCFFSLSILFLVLSRPMFLFILLLLPPVVNRIRIVNIELLNTHTSTTACLITYRFTQEDIVEASLITPCWFIWVVCGQDDRESL